MDNSASEEFHRSPTADYTRQNFIFKYLVDEHEDEFAHFIEKTGIPKILIEAISSLNELPNKPDNPVEWLKMYFRQDAPKREEEISEEIIALRNEILEKASKLVSLREEEAWKSRALRRLKRGDGYSDSDIQGKCYYDNSFLEVEPDPFFKITNSAQQIYGLNIKQVGFSIQDEISGIGGSSQEEIGGDADIEFQLKMFRQRELEHQLDELDNRSRDNQRNETTNDKYLHFNSPVDSSDSQENLNKQNDILFPQTTQVLNSREKAGKLEVDVGDGNPRKIKKTKKGKGSPHTNLSAEKHKPKTQDKKAIKELEEKDEILQDVSTAKSGTITIEKIAIDLRKGSGEEHLQNISEDYWKQSDTKLVIQEDSEDSYSEEDWSISLSKFQASLSRQWNRRQFK